MTQTERVDLRVDLIRRVEDTHAMRAAGTEDCSQGEHWRCRCGASFVGKGALEIGHRHVATEILSALDAAAAWA